MSKIQEALRKIKVTAAAAADKHGRVSIKEKLPTQIAELTRAETRIADKVESSSSRIIKFDRKLLQEIGLLAPENQERFMADQYRLIKRPLLNNVTDKNSNPGDHMNLVVVTSALPGDGKTFNCINLALSIATEKDTSILLVDSDVAKPHISRLLGIEGEVGLIDVLTDDSCRVEDAIIQADIPGLCVLPAGQWSTNATELLASRRMAAVVDRLSKLKKDGIVIFDSPPILSTSEAHVLASRMGQIVMVIRAGHTPQHAVIEALSSFDESQAVNLVLNQAASGFSAEGYGKYGYGYGYGN